MFWVNAIHVQCTEQKQQHELEKEMEALQMSTDASKIEMIPTSPSQNSRYNI